MYSRTLSSLAALLLTCGWAAAAAPTGFTTRWLNDDPYWNDGKAEFNIYDAQLVRYGAPRTSEVIHIFVREPFSVRELVKSEPRSDASATTYPVLKLNQIIHIPTGVYVYQQMHSAFWRVNTGALIKATLTSNDSCGNTYKEFRALAGLDALVRRGWEYEWHTYWEGMSAGKEKVSAPADAIFYDELPMRVRTLNFNRHQGAFDLFIAPTVIRSKKDTLSFEKSRISWTTDADAIHVTVQTGTATDEFLLDPKPPYLLRQWKMADGGLLKLRRSLKLDYWNYNQPGDLERALNAAPPPKTESGKLKAEN